MNPDKRDFEENTLNIMAVGDISFGDHYFSMGHGPTARMMKYGPESIFADVREVLSNADICFGNLEGAVSLEGYNPKSFSSHAFRGHPMSVSALSAVGFNILNIANNHICQHGAGPAQDTLDELNRSHIGVVGKLGEDEYFCEPIISIVNDHKIGVLGYSAVDEAYLSEQRVYAEFDESKVFEDVTRLKAEVDQVVLSLHFGEEAVNEPDGSARELAHKLVDAGVDILLGHHPHVFHEVENYKGAIIAYSLGNFVFDLLWDKRLVTTAILSVEINDELHKEVVLHPVEISSQGLPKLAGGLVKLNLHDGESYSLYRHKTPKLPESVRKTLYLARNMFRGHVLLKLQFLWWKIANGLSRKWSAQER